MIKYKLTDQNMQTYGGFQWEIGKWYEATGRIEQGLCTDGWLHCYDSPLLAVLHNPIHGRIRAPRLFEAETRRAAKDNNEMKRGYRMMRLVREIPVPEITTARRVKYAILCAKQVYSDPDWNKWADDWLSGKDRTGAYAYTVKDTHTSAAIAAHSAASAVFYAARAAIKANDTDAAAYIVNAACTADTAYAVGAACAVDAACAAVDAACAADIACIVAAAACAAEAAAGAVDAATKNTTAQLDLIGLAEEAMK